MYPVSVCVGASFIQRQQQPGRTHETNVTESMQRPASSQLMSCTERAIQGDTIILYWKAVGVGLC